MNPNPPADLTARVRAAWATHLGHDDFDGDADFFAIGGHSLLVARIMAELSRAAGTRLPLRMFFAHPTVRSLAAAIAEQTAPSTVRPT